MSLSALLGASIMMHGLAQGLKVFAAVVVLSLGCKRTLAVI